MITYALDTKTIVPILFSLFVAEVALLALFPAAQSFVREVKKQDDITGFNAAKSLQFVSLMNALSIGLSIIAIVTLIAQAQLYPTYVDWLANWILTLKTIQFSAFVGLLTWYVLKSNPT